MRILFLMGLLAALASCAAPEAQSGSSATPSEEPAAQQPESAKEVTMASQLVGKRLCRYPGGPDDTGNFEIELLEAGKVEGTGDISGAAGSLKLNTGQWQLHNSSLQIDLIFKSQLAGEEQENLVKFELSSTALLESQEECMAVHPAF